MPKQIWNYDVDPEDKKEKKDKSFFYPYMNAYGSAQFTPAKFLDHCKNNLQADQDLSVLSFRKERYLFCEREDGTVFSVQLADDKTRTNQAISGEQLCKEERALAQQIMETGVIQVYEGAVPDDDNEITSVNKGLRKDTEIFFSYQHKLPESRESLSPTNVDHSDSDNESIELENTGKNVRQEVVVRVYTEEEFLKMHDIELKRYPTANGKTPGQLEVDAFVKDVISGNFSNIWGHCHGGNSRTAMYMAMYDYMYLINNPQARDIKAEQIKAGLCIDPWAHPKLQPPARKKYDSDANGTSKYEASMRKYEARRDFLDDFKNYVDAIKKESGHGFSENFISWSEWQAIKDHEHNKHTTHYRA